MMTNTNKTYKNNFIGRIKGKWSTRSRAFKIYYLLLWLLSLISLGICIWSLIFVEWTRNDIIKVVKPHYDSFVELNKNWTAEQWTNAAQSQLIEEKFFALIHNKYHGDLDKFSWLWASRQDAYMIPGIDSAYTRLSHICYPLFVVFAFIWAPITVYCVASFLNVSLPIYPKNERKAMKEQAQRDKAFNELNEHKKPPMVEVSKNQAKPTNVKAIPAVKYDAPKNKVAPKPKLKGDWLYYHARQKQKDPHKKGGN